MCNPSPGLSPQRTEGDKPTTKNTTNIPKRNQPPTSKDKETSEKKQNPKPTRRTTQATTNTANVPWPPAQPFQDSHNFQKTPPCTSQNAHRTDLYGEPNDPRTKGPPSAHLHTTPRIKKKRRNPHRALCRPHTRTEIVPRYTWKSVPPLPHRDLNPGKPLQLGAVTSPKNRPLRVITHCTKPETGHLKSKKESAERGE